MIIVHINPTGIEGVYFESNSESLEDLSLAVWPLIRKHLKRLQKDLKTISKFTLESLENKGNKISKSTLLTMDEDELLGEEATDGQY